MKRRIVAFSFLVSAILNFNSIEAAGPGSNCAADIARMSAAKWLGRSVDEIAGFIKYLKTTHQMGEATIYVIVSDAGSADGADTTPRVTLELNSKTNGVTTEKLGENRDYPKTAVYRMTGLRSSLGAVLESLPLREGSKLSGLRYAGVMAPWLDAVAGPAREPVMSQEPADVLDRTTKALLDSGAEVATSEIANRPLDKAAMASARQKIRDELADQMSNQDHPQTYRTFEGFRAVTNELSKFYGRWSFRKMWRENDSGVDVVDSLRALDNSDLIRYVALRRPNPEKMEPGISRYIIELVLLVPARPPSKAMPRTVRMTLDFDWRD